MLGAWLGMYYPQIKTWIEAQRSEQAKKKKQTGIMLWAIWSFIPLIYELLYSSFAFTGLQMRLPNKKMLYTSYSKIALQARKDAEKCTTQRCYWWTTKPRLLN